MTSVWPPPVPLYMHTSTLILAHASVAQSMLVEDTRTHRATLLPFLRLKRVVSEPEQRGMHLPAENPSSASLTSAGVLLAGNVKPRL